MTIDTDLDAIRLMIGDTDPDDPLLYDDEVDYFIEQRTFESVCNRPAAAADCCGAIVAKYARDFDFSEDGQQFSRAQRVGHYREQEAILRRRSGGSSVPLTLPD